MCVGGAGRELNKLNCVFPRILELRTYLYATKCHDESRSGSCEADW